MVLAIRIIMAPGQLWTIPTEFSSGKPRLSIVVPLLGLKSKTPLLSRMFTCRKTSLVEQFVTLAIRPLLGARIRTESTWNSTATARQTFVLTMYSSTVKVARWCSTWWWCRAVWAIPCPPCPLCWVGSRRGVARVGCRCRPRSFVGRRWPGRPRVPGRPRPPWSSRLSWVPPVGWCRPLLDPVPPGSSFVGWSLVGHRAAPSFRFRVGWWARDRGRAGNRTSPLVWEECISLPVSWEGGWSSGLLPQLQWSSLASWGARPREGVEACVILWPRLQGSAPWGSLPWLWPRRTTCIPSSAHLGLVLWGSH